MRWLFVISVQVFLAVCAMTRLGWSGLMWWLAGVVVGLLLGAAAGKVYLAWRNNGS